MQQTDEEGSDGPHCDRCGACDPDMDVYCMEDEDHNPVEFLCVDCYETTKEYKELCDAQDRE